MEESTRRLLLQRCSCVWRRTRQRPSEERDDRSRGGEPCSARWSLQCECGGCTLRARCDRIGEPARSALPGERACGRHGRLRHSHSARSRGYVAAARGRSWLHARVRLCAGRSCDDWPRPSVCVTATRASGRAVAATPTTGEQWPGTQGESGAAGRTRSSGAHGEHRPTRTRETGQSHATHTPDPTNQAHSAGAKRTSSDIWLGAPVQ